MKKIILVNASPRKKGNCAKALSIIAETVKDAEVEIFDLNQKTVKPCLACGACKKKDTPFCIQKDDMADLLSRLDTCDALVVASPIYFGMVNGPAKTFLDRIYPFFNPAHPNMTSATKFGKKAAVILTAGSSPVDAIENHGAAYACFDVAGFTDKKILGFNSAQSGMDQNIFSIDEDADKIKALADWLCQ